MKDVAKKRAEESGPEAARRDEIRDRALRRALRELPLHGPGDRPRPGFNRRLRRRLEGAEKTASSAGRLRWAAAALVLALLPILWLAWRGEEVGRAGRGPLAVTETVDQAASLGAGAMAGEERRPTKEGSAAGLDREALRRASEEIRLELAALRRDAVDPPSTLYLGSDGEADFYVDLGELAQRRADRSNTLPAVERR